MPRTTAMQACFNAGELSPDMSGRIDLALFAQGLSRMENFLPLVQGPAKRVPGTRYVRSSSSAFLSQFQYSATEAYVLEWGRNRVWFSTNGKAITDLTGVATTITISRNSRLLNLICSTTFSVNDRLILGTVVAAPELSNLGGVVVSVSAGRLMLKIDSQVDTAYNLISQTVTLTRFYSISTSWNFANDPVLSITDASREIGCVLTIPNHGLRSYTTYFGTINGVVGMVQLNGNRYRMFVNDSSSLRLLTADTSSYIDSSGYTPYTSGGTLTIDTEPAAPWMSGNDYGIRFVQSNDLLYIANALTPPQLLARTAPSTFSMSPLKLTNGPFLDVNPDETRTVYATLGTTNTIGALITITASDNTVFKSTDVGRQIQLGARDLSTLKPWAVATAYTAASSFVRSDGKTYVALTSGTSGASTPVHTEGAVYDGTTGVQWQYLDAGTGWATITTLVSSTSVSATIGSYIPVQCLGVANTTTKWALGEFCSELGYPDFTTFFRERLVFARSKDQKVWMSVSGDYQNFSRKDASGSVVADMSIAIQVLSDQSNPIQWVMPSQALLVGTLGGEHFIQENNTQNPFGPDNITIKKITDNGGRYVQPCRLNSEVLYVQEAGRQLLGCSYSWAEYGYISRDLSLFANHMIQKKTAIVQLDRSRYPQLLVWILDNAGHLYCITLSKDQNVIGWSRILPGGTNVFVRSIVTIPSDDKDRDELWLLVDRTVNGTTLRSLEQMQADWDIGDDQKDAWYVDCGLSLEDLVTPFSVINGLHHLENETVNILADGAVHPQRVVTRGSVSLAAPANKVVIGLPNQCKLITLPLDRGQSEGTAQGKRKRLHHVTLRLVNSLGGYTGTNANDLFPLIFRNTKSTMGTSPFFTGDIRVESPGGWSTDGQLWYINSDPVPTEIVAIIPEAMVYEH